MSDRQRYLVRTFIKNMGYGHILRPGITDKELKACAEVIAGHTHS